MLSAATRAELHYGVLLGERGNIVRRVQLPRRSHAAVFNHHTGEALFFSRRPGTQLFIMNATSGLTRIVEAELGRHFYGHGVLSADGRYLLASENAYELSGRPEEPVDNNSRIEESGVISVRDVFDGYRQVAEFPSFGLGPHELTLLDTHTDCIVVANGGLRTDPLRERLPTNIDSMAPNLAVINWKTQTCVGRYFPPHHQLSLRHLSVHRGRVSVGAQFQGGGDGTWPLVYSANLLEGGSASLRAMKAGSVFAQEHKQYTASVCSVDSGEVVVSCPKANRLTVWKENRLHNSILLRDSAGVCGGSQAKHIVCSSGDGSITHFQLEAGTAEVVARSEYPGLRWDNHLIKC